MLQSKLYQVFAVLSAAQKRELRGWIRLPLINQREEVEQLWAFLENGNTANIGDFHRDKAIDFVFGKNKMAEKQNLQQDLRYAQTWLLTAIEKYLIYKESNENNTQNAASLAKAASNACNCGFCSRNFL